MGISSPVKDLAVEADEGKPAFIGDPITSLANGPAELWGRDNDVGSRSTVMLALDGDLFSSNGGWYVVLLEPRLFDCENPADDGPPALEDPDAASTEDAVDSSSDEKSYPVPVE